MIKFQDVTERAKALLEEGKVRSVLGYKKDSEGFMSLPVFVTDPEEADQLVWDPTCVHNLALYLVEEKKRQRKEREPDERPVAVIAKGCDSRSVNVLLQENYFTRAEVVVLGISCEGSGVLDQIKLDEQIGMKIALNAEFAKDDKFKVTTDEGNEEFSAKDILADRCLECQYPYPVVSDEAFGEKVERDFQDRFHVLSAIEGASQEEKWDFWKHHFDRCIRCFACRSVCPMCYCDECVVDSIQFAVTPATSAEHKAHRVKWIERSAVTSENIGYHLIRAMHLAGRCTDCGECERVCPVNIPLRLLNNKLEKESRDMFDYVPGMDTDKPALVASFRDDDPNDFIR